MRHPGTAASRTPVVPDDEPAAGALPDLAGWLGRSGTVLTSPARRCAVPGAGVELRLRPWDLGTWTGRPWEELDLASWRTDPSYAGHGGESLEALADRVAGLLAAWHGRTGRLAAVTHGTIVKAAVVHALRAPLDAVWDLDVAPGSHTELHSRASGWRVTRVGCTPGERQQPQVSPSRGTAPTRNRQGRTYREGPSRSAP